MDVRAATKTGTKSGTTTTAYVEALRIDTRGCGVQGKLLLVIKNLHSSNSMKYKIDGYPYDIDGTLGGLAVAIKGETSIAGSAQVTQTDVDKGYAAVVVSVIKDSDVGTYQIDYTTY